MIEISPFELWKFLVESELDFPVDDDELLEYYELGLTPAEVIDSLVLSFYGELGD
jgi:hypothetical protein